MHHFFLNEGSLEGKAVLIRGNDVNHMKNVLRMKPGEMFRLTAEGADYLCRILSLDADEVRAEITESVADAELPVRIHLYQGLPKSDKMELIIQKAVELGAYAVTPVLTARVIVKLEEKKAESRRQRWQAIAESAAKQSGRSIIPEVGKMLSFRDALAAAKEADLAVIPYEKAAGMAQTRRILSEVKPGMNIAVFIGPEGGFEEKEILLAGEMGVKPVTLGKRILRTETAGLCILSALMIQSEEDF